MKILPWQRASSKATVWLAAVICSDSWHSSVQLMLLCIVRCKGLQTGTDSVDSRSNINVTTGRGNFRRHESEKFSLSLGISQPTDTQISLHIPDAAGLYVLQSVPQLLTYIYLHVCLLFRPKRLYQFLWNWVSTPYGIPKCSQPSNIIYFSIYFLLYFILFLYYLFMKDQ